MLAGDEHVAAHRGAIEQVEHRRDHARRDLLDLDDHPQFWKFREHFGQARHLDSLLSEWKRRAVEREHPAGVGVGELGIGHLRDRAIEPAHPLEMIVVGHDDFAVARHVDIEFEILNAGRDGGAKRFERIFRMSAGGTAMPKNARQRGREEIGIEVIAHFRCEVSQSQP